MSGLKLKSMADFIFNFGVDNVLSIVYTYEVLVMIATLKESLQSTI